MLFKYSIQYLLSIFCQITDSGLTYLTEKFDNVKIKSKDFEIKKSLINASEKTISKEVKLAIQTSYRRVVDYQKRKLPKSYTYKDRLGNTLGWTINPIRKIGIYVPGGTASYPSTLIGLVSVLFLIESAIAFT